MKTHNTYLFKIVRCFFVPFFVLTLFPQCRVNYSPIEYTEFEAKLPHSNCEKWSFPFHNFSVLNNQWGADKVKNDSLTICIAANKNAFGWKWNMPKKSFGVVAYPEIHYGIAPWTAVKNKPIIQLSAIKKFAINYNAQLVTTPHKYNISNDFWILKSDSIAPQNIHTEIMIWEDYNKFKPNGKFREEVSTSQGVYKLYVGKINRKKMGLKWQYIAFARNQTRTSGTIPVLELFTHLIQRNLLPQSAYLSAIEMGTELSNSDGYIIFNQYEVKLNDEVL